MERGKGYTLAEVLTTVVILAVIAAVAAPNFSKSKDKGEADQVIAQLRTIKTAQKMYFAREGGYACQAATDCDTATEIRAVLGAEILPKGYAYSVTATSAGFLARARKGNLPSTANTCMEARTICLNEAGVWSGTYASLPAN